MRKYIEPNVSLIDGTSIDLAFYVWLKSREHVLKNGYKKSVKVNISNDPFNSDYIYLSGEDGVIDILQPGLKFYVDKELVEYEEYRNRVINGLGLQFNNFPQYVFEIDGSALFRDFLYTVNWANSWAVSNRFLFSTLSDEDVVKEESYPISGEYKDVPEWEEQFSEYMKLIQKTNITDDNRPEMPYSISSAFWWGCNHKTLISVLSAMKIKFPFFYEVYGKKMMKVTGIEESSLKNYIDYSLDQYFLRDWEKGSVHTKGMYLIDTEVDYIILSQFIRQSPSIVAGVWDTMTHDNAEEFSHKVIKGSTTCKIRFVASDARTLGTVSNRCCNFAANSGSGTGSWSGFLDEFLKYTNTPDELRKVLPCKFGKDGLLAKCVMYDDVKFRGKDGAESRNCVCPLLTCNIEDAKVKLERDKNKLGQLFYNLTEDLISKGGKEYVHKMS